MLDVFDIKLGTDTVPYHVAGDDDALGIIAVQLLDAVQTIVDVLTDNDTGKGYDVTFTPTMDAYTDRSAKRRIVISVKPLLDAKPGTPLAVVAAIMAGFAIHEIGHTKLDFYTAVKARWPGKSLPMTLANIIEDVVLEARTTGHYNGFADHGDGNIFHPTLVWVAKETCPTTPLEWAGSTGHKVNVTGQIVRYRPFTTYATDEATAKAVAWVEAWAWRMTADLTPSGCVEMIEDWLDYVAANPDAEPPVVEEPPLPDWPGGDFPSGSSLPNEDPDDGPTEGGENDGEDDGEGNPGGNTEGGDTEDDETPDGGNGTEGEDGDDEGGSTDDDGDGDTEGGESGSRDGDGNDADHGNRTESDKGTNDGDGAGGSGQSVSEASDPLDDEDLSEVGHSWDELSRPNNTWEQNHVAEAEGNERVTTRIDAGAFGKMRVIFK